MHERIRISARPCAIFHWAKHFSQIGFKILLRGVCSNSNKLCYARLNVKIYIYCGYKFLIVLTFFECLSLVPSRNQNFGELFHRCCGANKYDFLCKSVNMLEFSSHIFFTILLTAKRIRLNSNRSLLVFVDCILILIPLQFNVRLDVSIHVTAYCI